MIHPGGLGDVLLAVPAMTRLRTRFPKHRLVLCAEDKVARLLLACRIIDEWTSMRGRACADLFAGADSAQVSSRNGWRTAILPLAGWGISMAS